MANARMRWCAGGLLLTGVLLSGCRAGDARDAAPMRTCSAGEVVEVIRERDLDLEMASGWMKAVAPEWRYEPGEGEYLTLKDLLVRLDERQEWIDRLESQVTEPCLGRLIKSGSMSDALAPAGERSAPAMRLRHAASIVRLDVGKRWHRGDMEGVSQRLVTMVGIARLSTAVNGDDLLSAGASNLVKRCLLTIFEILDASESRPEPAFDRVAVLAAVEEMDSSDPARVWGRFLASWRGEAEFLRMRMSTDTLVWKLMSELQLAEAMTTMDDGDGKGGASDGFGERMAEVGQRSESWTLEELRAALLRAEVTCKEFERLANEGRFEEAAVVADRAARADDHGVADALVGILKSMEQERGVLVEMLGRVKARLAGERSSAARSG